MIWRLLTAWLDRRAEDRIIGRCMLCGGRRGDAVVIQQRGAEAWVHERCDGEVEL